MAFQFNSVAQSCLTLCNPVIRGQTDPVSSLGSVCLWEQVRQGTLGTPTVGEPTLKRRDAGMDLGLCYGSSIILTQTGK